MLVLPAYNLFEFGFAISREARRLVETKYDNHQIMQQLCDFYQTILASKAHLLF